MAISSRRLPRSLYAEIDRKLTQAQQSITDREEQLAKMFDEVEKDLELLGATAVEDKYDLHTLYLLYSQSDEVHFVLTAV